jgi:hypothetical protein
MKKLFPLIAVAFIAVVVLISVIPDYKESQKPFNKFLSFAKSNGFGVAVLVKDDVASANAVQEIIKLEKNLGITVHTAYYTGDEAVKMAAEQLLTVPAFFIADGDGNLAVKEKGEITAQRLVPYFSDLHTH